MRDANPSVSLHPVDIKEIRPDERFTIRVPLFLRVVAWYLQWVGGMFGFTVRIVLVEDGWTVKMGDR